jgi:hypothetical protein
MHIEDAKHLRDISDPYDREEIARAGGSPEAWSRAEKTRIAREAESEPLAKPAKKSTAP